MSYNEEWLDWMSLIDVSGPFLAGSVIEDAFPQGLEKVPTPKRQRIRAAYEEWDEAVQEVDKDLDALHGEWVRLVLQELLEYEDKVLVRKEKLGEESEYCSPEHGVKVSPDFAVRDGSGQIQIVVSVYPPKAELEQPIRSEIWSASPAERMALLCRHSKVGLGLVTNGERWMLVSAPTGETSSYVTWYSRLWFQEPLTLKAFQSLLGVRRIFGPPEERLDKLLERSLEFQEEVTNTLGEQVRRAVEVLIQSLGRADEDRNGELLKDVDPEELYEAGLTVMMRLVFLLCAEERGLLLLGDTEYDQNYAVSTLRGQLRDDADQHGVEVLERRYDAWSRILAVFRAVYGGVDHEALRMPALGGSIFDPDRFPFLEGRAKGSCWLDVPAVPLPIDNRTVLLLLRALQVLEHKRGAQVLSYRALDVEQIGHVYEGLLEYTVARCAEATLTLIGTKKIPSPTLRLSDIEKFSDLPDDAVAKELSELTGRSASGIENALRREANDALTAKLIFACHGDEVLRDRIRRYESLIQTDGWGELLVYQAGSFVVIPGTDRRSSGTHYTPRSLTEPIVKHTLEPLVYVGPPEGAPAEKWQLKPPSQILDIKICDMACGSGAFLVEAVRYLAYRLVEAWEQAEQEGKPVTLEGKVVEQIGDHEMLPVSTNDRVTIARRLVAQSCIYGVDINELAVELAKLSLWLITLAKNKAFGFLDHAIRCGDSLVGIHDIEQLKHFSLKPDNSSTPLFKGPLDQAVSEAIELRLKLEDMPSDTVEDVEAQEKLLAEAEDKIARLRCSADMLVAAEFWSENASDKKEKLKSASALAANFVEEGPTEEFIEKADIQSRGQKMFHWPLEFPEVIVKRGGYDAFVGNPPFQGGTVASTTLGVEYMAFIKTQNEPWHGKSDLVGVFFRQAARLSDKPGFIGFLATASLIRGETVESSIVPLLKIGSSIFRGQSPFPWPGQANVTAVCVWISQSVWNSYRILDGEVVEFIGPDLEPASDGQLQEPFSLIEASPFGALGVKLSPTNLIKTGNLIHELQPELASAFVHVLGGDEIYGLSDLSKAAMAIDADRVSDHALQEIGNVFACELSGDKVRHSAPAKALQGVIATMPLLFACGETTHKQLAFIRVPPKHYLLKHKAIGFPSESWSLFTILQSEIHVSWAWKYGIRRKEDLCYSPKRCAATFPLIDLVRKQDWEEKLAELGHNYHKSRSVLMVARDEGLTSLYNRFHDNEESSTDIERLRILHVRLDEIVAAAYGWDDLDFGRDFHETKQGFRFTISEAARREVLQRLLKLNHARYAKEVKEGLHDKKKKRAKKKQISKKRATKRKEVSGPTLFGKDETKGD